MLNKKLKGLSKVFIENFWSVWLLVAVSLIFIFVSKQDSLAELLWQKYRWPNLAVLIIRSDADLAMFIGNYYFNGVVGGGEYNLGIAQKAYRKAVRVNPKVLWGHYQLARIYFIKSDFNSAFLEINKELEANPENLRSLYVRGLIYGYRNQAGDLEKAEADFRRFTLWAPTEWAGYNDLSWILSKNKKYAEAEIEIKRALENIPEANNNPWLLTALGVAQLNLKKYSSAAVSFKRAKELAGKLTEKEWRVSYPGNDPASAGKGLSAFIAAIEENLHRAESKK